MPIGYAVGTLAELRAIAAIDREDKLAIRVADEKAWYQWRDGITEGIIPDDNPVTGRWQRDTRSRKEVIVTTASLADNAHQQTSFTSTPGLICYQIATDKAARIRIYNNTTKQAADISRAVPTTLQEALDFNANSAGLLLDVVTTNSLLTVPLSPIINIATIPSSTSIPITITNLSGSTGTVQVTLTIMEIE